MTASQNHSRSRVDQVFSPAGDTRDRPKALITRCGLMISNEAVNLEAGLGAAVPEAQQGPLADITRARRQTL